MILKYYTIREGKKTWVFDSRDSCKELVNGYPWARYKSFSSRQEAEKAFQESYESHYIQKPKDRRKTEDLPFEKNSIAVDAACSGNPWAMEYKWIDLETGEIIFHQKFSLWTNNIWEFLALVHGLSYLQKNNSNKSIYSDSKHAMKWILEKKCKTKLEKTSESKSIFEIICKAEERLQSINYTNKILKRNTIERGEIPADFWRK